jgi:hypothetical protein
VKISRHLLNTCIAILMTVVVLLSAADAGADLRPLADAELSHISGAGGLSIGIADLSVYMNIGSFSYTDTDTGNALVLEGITVTDGNHQPASFNVGAVDTNGDGIDSPLTLDVGTINDLSQPASGKPVMRIEAPDWQQAVDLHMDTLRFCGQALGSLDIGVIRRPTFYWLLGAHSDGVDFEFGQRLSIDTLRLTYTDPGDSLALAGIHLGASDPGAPEDPSTWQMGGLFRIGALAEGNPATFDVGTGAEGSAAVVLNLPMSGALRVENVHWSGTDFGPIAIDGIQVHHLSVSFTP